MLKARHILPATLWISVVCLTGCVNPGKNLMPADTGPSMAHIYSAQTGAGVNDLNSDTSDATNSPLPSAPAQITDAPKLITNADYTMNAQDQVNTVFKLLPNPTIAVYIFPHMTQFQNTDVPVPGYTTAFFLYEKNHYAMPGEVY